MSDIRYNGWLHRSGTGGVWQDSSGRVGIGTSVGMNCLVNSGPNALTFGTGATPAERVRIDSSGRLLIGKTTSTTAGWGNAYHVQLEGTGSTNSSIQIKRNSNDNGGPYIFLGKSRGTSVDSDTIVQDGDEVGTIAYHATDGTDANCLVARIVGAVDGTPGANDMPGRLMFMTTADGATDATERLRITAAGDIHSLSSVQSGGNASSGFKIGGVDTSCYIAAQGKSAANGGSAGNAVFQGWFGDSNTFRVNCDGLIKTSKGIDFSGAQTNLTGMTSETLDAYEEGVYTATLTCISSGTVTVSSSWDQLAYTKIGRVVYVTGRIRMSAVSSPSGAQLRLNLPVVSASGTEDLGRVNGFVYVQSGTKEIQDYTSMPTQGGNTYIQIGFADTTNSVDDVCATITASTLIAVNFHYITS